MIMKYMILSDIHGSSERLQVALSYFTSHQCNHLILLGDILYHGPRNPLPPGHAPQEVVKLLNAHASHITSVRGNCEAEVDQMVLNFSCLGDYATILDHGRRLFLTHGHVYHEEHLPPLNPGDIFLYGHTHLWTLKEKDRYIICNPGSIALPKENRPPTFALYDTSTLAVYTLDGTCIANYTF
jgi:hypothetical protein